ncbi:aliphatic nitrilase-like protein [Ilyonectria robusta]|uniref:aliphatic nitrilase-like protein n=1 Tax=Ilyonectria robusta TaxID=1079257 RepID=UPI001E8D3358|nr:aliphatic nitrilase-like protein [Ilyonectria robusta]KAH8684026.1 aliphatic nitrilase-like protein [Ilyonectria robusta]
MRSTSATSLTAALIRASPALWTQPITSRVYNGVDINETTNLGVKYIDRAAREGANLVAFPELWFPGYPRGNDAAWIEKWVDNYIENSIRQGDRNWKKLVAAAKRNSVYVALGFSERVDADDAIYMAQALIDPRGKVLIHRHKLRPSGGERSIWSDGKVDGLKVVNTPYGRMGLLECWEHFHPAMTFPMQAQAEAIHIASWPYTPDPKDISAQYWESAEVNMAAASLYAVNSGAYTLVATVGRAAAFGPDGLEFTSIPAYVPSETSPFLMLSINTTGFSSRPAYNIDGEQSWGILKEIEQGWPEGVPKKNGTFRNHITNPISKLTN